MVLENLEVYQISMVISQKIWDLVKPWHFFEKDTIGKQLVRSADSVTANISEGYGRFHFKEAKNFFFIARGSLFETKSWIQKAYDRKLIEDEEFKDLERMVTKLTVKLNNLIKVTMKNQNLTNH